MPPISSPAQKPLGRPRAFRPEDALDAASRVFRRQGYYGASLKDLTAAMGINRPSCYAAFGDKEALFFKVLERYTGLMGEVYRSAFAQPTAHAVAAYLLGHTVALAGSDDLDPCLFALAGAPGDPLAEAIGNARKSLDRALKRRLKQAQRAGDLPPAADTRALAALLSAVLRGLASQAAEGVPRAALQAQAETLLQLFAPKHLP